MTENISLIKSSGIDLYFLADKLLENKIISLEKKKEVTDRFNGRTADERMDELLHYLMKSIEVEGKEVFDIFLEILKKEDTRLSLRLAEKLSDAYDIRVCILSDLTDSITIVGHCTFHLKAVAHPSSFNWDRYGFRLHCPEGAVSKDTEVDVTPLLSNQFEVPKGTVLVSAVYKIKVSKPLSKRVVIELQHCVDLRNIGQTRCLKFVRAPSLKSPYQFNIIDGGVFHIRNRYGSIERDDFCAIGIVAEMSNGGSSNGGGNSEGGNGGGSKGGGEGGDNVNGSSEAPTEGIILIVFALLMMCL